MPVREPLVILIAILLVAVPIAHDLPAASEQCAYTAASHCLVAIPVALSVTDSGSVIEDHLAVHAWA